MDLKIAFNALMEILNFKFVLYGFTVSMWQIVMFLIVASLLIYLIGGLLQ